MIIHLCKKCKSNDLTLVDVSDGFAEYFDQNKQGRFIPIDKSMGDLSYSYLKCNSCKNVMNIRMKTRLKFELDREE